jgi:hypothetical protein
MSVKSALAVGLGMMIVGSAVSANGQCCKKEGQGKCEGAGQAECGQKKCKGEGQEVRGQGKHKGAGQEKCGHGKRKGDGQEKRGQGKRKGNGQEKRGMGKENCPWASERDEFRKGQREKVEAFMKKRHEVMKSSREAAKNEEDPKKIIAMIKSNHKKAAAEAKEFFSGIEKENDKFLTSVFSKYEVSEKEQAEIKEHVAAKRNRMKKMHKEHSKKMIEALNKLEKKDDLTKEDIRNTMREMHRGPKHGHGDKGHKEGHKRGGRGDDHKRGGHGDDHKGGKHGHGDKDHHERGGKRHGQGGHGDSDD